MVVDDEPRIVEVVRDYLADAGFRVSTARSGEEALQHLRSVIPDLVVLDLGLPGVDGLDVARAVRQRSAVPIIMLTARSDEADRVVGLELGADDYVVKPFSPRELLARVRAVLRRTTAEASTGDDANAPLVVRDLRIDRARRRVTRGDEVVELTAGDPAAGKLASCGLLLVNPPPEAEAAPAAQGA
ncbi:MAG: response regulator transcription factor [Limnochordales bacterium]